MMRELAQDEIIFLGRAQAALRVWQGLHDVAVALYGAQARFVTCSVITVPVSETEFERGPEVIVCDADRAVLPFDPAAEWWQAQDCRVMTEDLWQNAHLDVLIGASLPDPISTALRGYVEERLGIEFIHAWEAAPPLVMTADLSAPPMLPFVNVQTGALKIPVLPFAGLPTDAGRLLDAAAIIQAGNEWEGYRLWARVREYTHMLYGPQAVRMEITSLWIYNDSSYDERPYFTVLDAEDRQIAYDLTLPWWRRFAFAPDAIARYAEEHPQKAPGERSPITYESVTWEDATSVFPGQLGVMLDTLRRDLLGIEFSEIWGFQDAKETDYDLLTPPVLTYPVIMADDRLADQA
jgi:hypothetical protein